MRSCSKVALSSSVLRSSDSCLRRQIRSNFLSAERLAWKLFADLTLFLHFLIAEFLRIPIIIPEFNSGILRLSYCGLRAQRFMSTTCENSLLVIFFFISICWGASPTKIKQLAHLVGCIISTVLISQQYVKFLIRNPAYQNRIAQWSGKLLSRQHLCTGLRWFFSKKSKISISWH